MSVLILAGWLAVAGASARPADPVAAPNRVWLAKKGKAEKSDGPAKVEVTTALPVLELKVKKLTSKGVLVKPAEELTATIEGRGKLAVVVYQALRPDEKVAKEKVSVSLTANGKSAGSVSFKGKLDQKATALGPESPLLSRSKSKVLKVAGTMTLTLRVPHASSAAVVDLQFFAGKSRSPTPVTFVVPAPSESPPVAEAPPSEEVLPPPDAPPLAPEPPVAAVEVAAPQPGEALLAQIRAGELREGELGEFPRLTITDKTTRAESAYALATAERPYRFAVDGPGTVTVYVHRLAGLTGASAADTLTILENDILLQSFELDAPLDPNLEVSSGQGATRVEEYRLNVAGKLSQLVFQPAESAAAGIAVRYAFEPAEKGGILALSLDLGDGLGGDTMAPQTTITEVAVREKVVQVSVEVEKVVRVERELDETVGIAVTGGAVVPLWGGTPAPAAGVELQWILPFAKGALALSAEGQAQMYTLLGRGVDPLQAEVRSRSFIWAVPVRVGPTYRHAFTDSLRLAFAGRGTFAWLTGTAKARGGEASGSATVLGGAAAVSLEVRIGAGWWSLDTGYGWTQSADIGAVVRDFSPSGFELGTRFRFVL